jgi:hypothetical protein
MWELSRSAPKEARDAVAALVSQWPTKGEACDALGLKNGLVFVGTGIAFAVVGYHRSASEPGVIVLAMSEREKAPASLERISDVEYETLHAKPAKKEKPSHA